MKLVSFIHDGRASVGRLQDDGETVRRIELFSDGRSTSMQDVIAGGDDALAAIVSGEGCLSSLEDVQLLPPLVSPGAIFCVGLNYADHEQEAPVKGTDYPTIFLRLARNQIAHGEPMIVPSCSPTLDWEGELVAVIARQGRHIAAKNALDHIFGYSIYNEASVRDYQHHSSQFGLGKNFEGTGAFGPSIITADAFGDPYSHEIETRLDHETVQSARIDAMLHRIEDVIEYISSATTLRPGDIICTGTPSGVGAARKPQRFMQDGETVSVSISGIGTLRNPVRAESQAQVMAAEERNAT